MLFLSILQVLNFDSSKFEQLLNPIFTKCQIYQNSKLRVSKIAKNDIFVPFMFTKVWAMFGLTLPSPNTSPCIHYTLIDLSIYKLGPAFANIYGLGAIYVRWLFAHRKIKPTRIFNIEPFGPLAIQGLVLTLILGLWIIQT